MARDSIDGSKGLSETTRISSLADGVFAIVMTLLVLGVDVPQVPDEKIADQLLHEVLLLWPLILAYVVSFLVLGIYWMGHHSQFHFLRAVDRTALWMNILFFMFLSLVPFTSKIVGRYSGQEIALVLYGTNLLVISLVLLAHWEYASRAGLIESSLGKENHRKVTRQILIGASVFVAGIAMAFVKPSLSLFVFLLAPALHILPGPIHLHWTR